MNNTAREASAVYCDIADSKQYDLDNNWWGSNNPNFDNLINNGITLSSYAVLNVTADTKTIAIGSKAKLNYTFYRNGTDAALAIPSRPISLSATGGQLDDDSGYLINGKFSTEFGSDRVDNYEITAKVDNQDVKISVNVIKAGSSVVITGVTNGVYNTTNATVTYTIENRTTVTFKINNTGIVVDETPIGQLAEKLAGLAAGDYTITIINAENGTVKRSEASGDFSVARASSSVTVPDSNVEYGSITELTVSAVNASEIEAALYNGATKLRDLQTSGLSISLDVTGLPVGSYTLNVTTKPGSNYNADSKNGSVVVGPAGSSVVITGVTPGVYHTTTATVAYTIENRTVVTFKINNTGIVVDETPIGQLAEKLAGLAAGDYTITIINAENETFTRSEGSADFNVARASSSVTVPDTTNVEFGSVTDLTVGAVNASEIGAALYNGATKLRDLQTSGLVISLDVTGLPVGSYTLNVTTKPGSNYNADSKNGSVVVKAGSSVNVIDVDDGVYDTPVVVSFTIPADSNATGITNDVKVYNATTGDVITGLIVTVNNDAKTVTIYDLAAGDYKVNVTTIPKNEYYDSAVCSGNVHVNPKVNKVTLTIDNVEYGAPVVVSIANAVVDGNYVVSIDAEHTVNVEVNSGSGSANANWDLAVGTDYKATVSLNNANYNTTGSDYFNVTAAGSSVVVPVVGEVTYGDSRGVTISSYENVSSVVAVLYKGGSPVSGGVSYSGFEITISNALDVGTYTLRVTGKAMDDNHKDSGPVDREFEVVQAGSSVVITGVTNGVYITTNATVTYTIENRTTVTFKINDTGIVVDETPIGQLAEKLAGLAAGDYTITIINAENETFTGSECSADFSVARASSSVVINSIVDGVYDTVAAVVDYDVVNGTTVTFSISNTSGVVVPASPISGLGAALAGLNAGDYSITIYNAEEGNYNASEDAKSFGVDRASSSVTVPDTTNVEFGSVTDLTVSAVNASEIEAALYDGVNKLRDLQTSGLVISLDVTGLPVATYTLNVTTKPGSNYNVDSKNGTVVVGPAGSSVTVNPTSASVDIGGSVVITVACVNATGFDAKLYSGSTEVTDAVNIMGDNVTVSAAGLSPGVYTLKVNTTVDGNHTAATADVSIVVNDPTPPPVLLPSRVTVPSSTSVDYGTAVIIRATDLVNAYGIGAILLDGNGDKISDLRVSGLNIYVDTAVLNVGNYNILVYTLVDTSKYTSYSTNGALLINKGTAVVNVEIGDVEYAKPIDVNVDVLGGAGKVNVTVAGVTKTAGLVNGSSKFTFDAITTLGEYKVDVVYFGDDKFNDFQTSESIEVVVPSVIIADNIKRGVNSPYDYYATLVDANGKPIAGREITFTIGGKTFKSTTDAEGIAKVAAGLTLVDNKETVYNVVVTNPDTFENVTATATIVPRLIVVSGDLTGDYLANPPYVVRAIGDDGNPVGENETVNIVFAGFGYDLKTNATGHVVRTIGLAPGMYAVKACYKGYNTTATVFVVNQILKVTSGTLKKTAKSYTLMATLKSSNGRALANKEVKLTFKGKTYKVFTNSKGVASKKISSSVIKTLKAGKTYTLQARYVNDIAKGKIKVVKK